MSTIIIITPPGRPQANKVVETNEGADIVNSDGQQVATFTGAGAYEKAIRYLKVMKD